MNKTFKIIFGIIILFAVIAISILIIKSLNKKEDIIRTGRVEMREYDIASKVPGRIDSIFVDEGDYVSKGQPLFILTTDELDAKKAQAKGAVDAAKGQLDMAYNGARPEQVDMVLRQYIASQSQYEYADATFKRFKQLHDEKLISDQQFDEINQKHTAAQQSMEAAKSQYDMIKSGARSEEKVMALGQYERALNAMKEVQTYINESHIPSYISGMVSKRYFDAGELIATGYPVFAVIDTNDVWVELNLPESELKHAPIGAELDGLMHFSGKTDKFKVYNYSAKSDYANWRAKNEIGTFEIRTFTVKLKPVSKIQGLRPGMSVSFNFGK